MNEIAGLPYIETRFSKDGLSENEVILPTGVTDIAVISHGWNNDAEAAREFYRRFFETFVSVGQSSDLAGRRFAILGVIWPSKKFDELVAVSGPPGGVYDWANLTVANTRSDELLAEKLEEMKTFFTEPAQQEILDQAKVLLTDIVDRSSARREFVNRIRSLIDPTAASRGDGSDIFLRTDGDELMKKLLIDEDDLADYLQPSGGATATSPGGAAGILGFKGSAFNLLNYTTYYEMKARAGNVGQKGVAELIDKLALQVQGIHLIGHSFGGRVVMAAAANSSTERIMSMSLLQPTLSQSGFSKRLGGFYRTVVDQRRVHGPIIVTHTKNDDAAALVYPLASRLSGDMFSAFADHNDRFGGLSQNGLQEMEYGEVIVGKLLPVGESYSFQKGKFANLEASAFVKDHGDVAGLEVAQAVRAAVAMSTPSTVGDPPKKSSWQKSAPPGGGPPPKSPPRKRLPKPVLLAISTPRQATLGSAFTARFAAYVSSFKAQVEKQLKALGQEGDRVVTDLPPDNEARWQPGAPVEITLMGDHVEIEPASHSFLWDGREKLLNFAIKVKAEVPQPTIQLRFFVFLAKVQVSFISVDIAISTTPDSNPPKIEMGRLPRSAFASYSSKDMGLVAQKLSAVANLRPLARHIPRRS